jgi:hypothetical protein
MSCLIALHTCSQYIHAIVRTKTLTEQLLKKSKRVFTNTQIQEKQKHHENLTNYTISNL